MTPEQIYGDNWQTDADAVEYFVMIAEQRDLHPVEFADMVEDLPYPVVIRGGDVDEVRPYRPAILTEEDTLPF